MRLRTFARRTRFRGLLTPSLRVRPALVQMLRMEGHDNAAMIKACQVEPPLEPRQL